jgi:FkbM family methyltransferase
MTATASAQPHHPIFDRFIRREPRTDSLAHYNFMGARISHDFEDDLERVVPAADKGISHGLKTSGRCFLSDDDPRYPLRNSEDYFEWIDLLTAIDRAEERFTMMEIGAGYGRWIANGAVALRQLDPARPLQGRFIALEASRKRFGFLKRNCAENKIDPRQCELHRVACTADGQPVIMKCDDDYGASVIKNNDILRSEAFRNAETVEARDQAGKRLLIEKVPSVTLQSLLIEDIDFLDMDIQGAELDVLRSNMALLTRKVKLAHIATHSLLNESRIASLFHLYGWRPRFLFTTQQENETQYGKFTFIDGIQSWENTALALLS